MYVCINKLHSEYTQIQLCSKFSEFVSENPIPAYAFSKKIFREQLPPPPPPATTPLKVAVLALPH